MPIAAVLALRAGDHTMLTSYLRASSASAGLVQRARIVLLAAEGVSNTEIARRVWVTRQTVVSWRDRYRDGGAAGLGDQERSGRPVAHDEVAVVVAHTGAAAVGAGCDAVVEPAAGRPSGYLVRRGGPDLA